MQGGGRSNAEVRREVRSDSHRPESLQPAGARPVCQSEWRFVERLRPRLKCGDRVFVRGGPPKSREVVDASDRSIVTLKSEHGIALKVGRLAGVS